MFSGWNHRFVRVSTDEGPQIALYEVYYNDAGVPVARSAEPATFDGYETPMDAWGALSVANSRALGSVLDDDFAEPTP